MQSGLRADVQAGARAGAARPRASPVPNESPGVVPGAEAAAALDRRLASLARARGPLRRALAAVAGRLVATRAWERLGFARLRDYAVERAGLSPRAVQELASVDRALGELPEVERALVTGEISWTKARLLTRIAEPESQAWWLARARTLTASELSREVRRVDAGSLEAGAGAVDEDGIEEGPRETVRIRCTPVARAKWWRARTLARRVAGEPLPPWVCAEAISAEVLATIPVDLPDAHRPLRLARPPLPAPAGRAIRRRAGRRASPCAGEGIAASWARRAELPLFLRRLLEGLDEADAFELDRRLRRAVALEQQLESQIGPLLREIADGCLHRALGIRDLGRFARERLGMSPRRAQMLVRLERAGDRCPEMIRAYREGRISWVQAHALVPAMIPDLPPALRAAWVQRAQRVTVRRLEEDVDRTLLLHDTNPEEWKRTAGIPAEEGRVRSGTDLKGMDLEGAELEGAQIGARPTAPEEIAQFFFSAPRDVARLVRAVVCSVRRRIERETGRLPSEGEAFEAMCDHVLACWSPDPEEQRRSRRAHRVLARDRWRCTVPGCSSQRNLHDHHIAFRSAGGSDELANRTTLCAWHHLRGVHAGIVRCRGRAPDGLRFELGIRAGAPPLERYGSGDVRLESRVA